MMADPIPLIERGLIVALMGWMTWRQHRLRDALGAQLWAQEVTISSDPIPKEIAAEATERIEIPQRHVAA